MELANRNAPRKEYTMSCCCGGPGSGSLPGKKASHWIDGRWAYRKTKTGSEHGVKGKVVAHKIPAPRNAYGNIVGPPRPWLHSKSNLKVQTYSQNAKGPTNHRGKRPK